MRDPRRGGRRIATERWLAGNGLPACVQGHSRPGAVLRRPLQLLSTFLVIFGGLVTLSLLADLGIEKTPPIVVTAVLACIAVSYVLTAVGVPALAIFTITWFVRALWRTGTGLAHVLPLLLVAVTFFFLTGETWMSIGRLTGIPFLLAFVLVLGLAIGALARRENSGLSGRRVEPDAAWFHQAVPRQLLPDGPVRYLDPPLRYAERLNLRLVSILGRALVAVVVGLVVATFFLVFGVIVVDASVAETFAGAPPGSGGRSPSPTTPTCSPRSTSGCRRSSARSRRSTSSSRRPPTPTWPRRCPATPGSTCAGRSRCARSTGPSWIRSTPSWRRNREPGSGADP